MPPYLALPSFLPQVKVLLRVESGAMRAASSELVRLLQNPEAGFPGLY